MSQLNVTTLKHESAGVDNITLDANGRVGIGTSSPNEKLTVVASTGGTGGIRVETQYGAGYFGNYNNYPAMMYNSSGLKPVVVYDTNNHITSLHTDNTERLRIDSAGRVTMPYQPAFSAHNGGANSSGAIVFATTLHNNGSHYSTSTGRFTAPVTGMYYFYTQHLANSGGFDVSFNKNGTRLLGHAESAVTNYKHVSNAQIIFMNAGDYVYVEVWAGSTYGLNYCMFTGHLIG